MSKYDIEQLRSVLERRGARFSRVNKEIDMSRPRTGVVGIDTLGKLQYMNKLGYDIVLPDYKFKSFRGNVGGGIRND